MPKNTFSVRTKTIGILVTAPAIVGVLAIQFFHIEHELLQLIVYSALVVGLCIFITGIMGAVTFAAKSNKSIHQQDAAVAASALMRCMIAVCASDNDLDDREINMIIKIYKQLMDSEITADDIRQAASQMQASEIDIEEELSQISGTLYTDLKGKILKASLYILAADGQVDPREEEVLEKIRKGLGYSKGKLERAKAAFFEEHGLHSNN